MVEKPEKSVTLAYALLNQAQKRVSAGELIYKMGLTCLSALLFHGLHFQCHLLPAFFFNTVCTFNLLL